MKKHCRHPSYGNPGNHQSTRILGLLVLAVATTYAGGIEFPDLPRDLNGNIARVGVSVPEGDGPFPMLVWFGGGMGTNDPDAVPPLVDRSRWIIAAIPTRGDVPRPLHAMHSRRIQPHWDYHRPMLEKLFESFPQIDRQSVVAAGMSNGGHLIASYLAQGRAEFIQNVSAFAVIEGSCAESSTTARLPDRPIYLAWGAEDGGSMGLMANIVSVARDAGMRLTTRTMPNVGHGFPEPEQQLVKDWLSLTFSENAADDALSQSFVVCP